MIEVDDNVKEKDNKRRVLIFIIIILIVFMVFITILYFTRNNIGYKVKGYIGEYDGKEHGIEVVVKDGEVLYGTKEGEYIEKKSPVRIDAGTTTVYYQIKKSDQETVTGKEDIIINPADNKLVLSETSGTYTYPAKFSFEVTENISNGELSCEVDNNKIATCNISENKVNVESNIDTGKAKITIKSKATKNYKEGSALYVLTVKKGDVDYKVSGYVGDYDGKEHGIEVIIKDAEVLYGTKEGEYTEKKSPTRVNAGKTTIYYIIKRNNKKDITGSKDIIINPAKNKIVLSETSGKYTYPADFSFEVSKNLSGGELSCEVDNDKIAKCNLNGNKVNIKSNTDIGKAKITIKSKATDNYKEGSALYTLTIEGKTNEYKANGYSGKYDGKAHGINVVSAGSTIKYGTSEGEYDKDKSPERTDAGTTTVYYQITRKNYKTVTGKEDIIIKRADGKGSVPTSIRINLEGTKKIDINNATGNITCESSNKNIVECSVSGKTLSLKGKSVGSASINVIIAQSNNYNSLSKKINVKVEDDVIRCYSGKDVKIGSKYVHGQYTYTYEYYNNVQGWKVSLTDKNSTSPVTSEICTYVDDKPVISASEMFDASKAKSIDVSSFNTSNVLDMSDMFIVSRATTIKGLEKFNTGNVTDMSSMFYGSSATSLNLSSFDTSNVTDMNDMFYYSKSTVLDLSSFDTGKVTNMSRMFEGSNATTIKGLEKFNTNKVTNMRVMFGDSKATSLDLSSFNTSKVTDMSWMFSGSSAITIKGLEKFNTSNVKSMDSMFDHSSATSLDLSSFDTSKVSNMGAMFMGSRATTIKGLEKFNTSNVTAMFFMFYDSKVTSLDLSSFDTSKVINMSKMFSNLNVTSLDLSSFNTSKTVNMSSMFSGNSATTIKGLEKFNTSNVTDMSAMFSGSKATSLDLRSFNTSNVTNMSGMFRSSSATNIKGLEKFNTSKVTDMEGMFNESKATLLDLSSFDTSKVTNMKWMFNESSAITIKGLEKFNTNKVTNMNQMFYNSKATSLDLRSFNTNNLTNMSGMFRYSSATSIKGLENFNTSKVTDMSYMFCDSKATSLDLRSFNTSNVTNMSDMFRSSSATSIKGLEKFDTSNVTYMNYMFYSSSATSLDLSSFDTGKVTDMSYMFCDSKATSLDLSSFDTSNVTDMTHMFLESMVTSGYARNQTEADKFNKEARKIIFTVKN